MTEPWTTSAIPALEGAVAVVTGATSGIGFHAALELARHGARVVLTARDPGRGDEALGQMRVQVPGADVELRHLDLADLATVRAFAAGLAADHDRVDLLVNNAGVMAVPQRRTADGFELQLGTNHLGHFALTGLLLPRLLAGELLDGPSRVVTVSSSMHRAGRLHRDDLMLERGYRPWKAYGQSKLANLLFAGELRRRALASGASLASLAAHPGFAATNLQSVGPRMAGSALRERLMGLATRLLAQSAEAGAWPTLRAATDPDAVGGQYFGPGGRGERSGPPVPVGRSTAAQSTADAAWLWERSVELTGVDYAFPAG